MRAQVWPDRSKLFETLTIFLIFFSYTLSRNKGADKTGGSQAGLGICCSNVSRILLPVVNGGCTFHTVAQYNIVICDRDSFLFSRDIGELTFCVMDQIRLEY